MSALRDPVQEAERIVGAASEARMRVRVVGGVAVALIAPSIRALRPARTYHDIDLVATGLTPPISGLMTALGYEPSARFNKLNGAERLLFHDADGRRVDVFIDRLRMCHTLELRHVLHRHPVTLSPADLLLSKLQIVEMTDRDAQDVAAILADQPVVEHEGDGIALSRIRDVCCSDWGWWQTVMTSLATLIARWTGAAPDPDGAGMPGSIRGTATGRAIVVRDSLVACPKSMAWRLRGAVGPRLRWYELPEEVR